MTCPNCGEESTSTEVCTSCHRKMSVVDDNLDTLVAQASVPNLAALFQSAKDKGLIQAQQQYGHAPVA